MWLPPPPEMKIPPANRLITSPRTVLPPAPMESATSFPDWLPSSSMIGLPAYPGWVAPSMIAGSSIDGRPESGMDRVRPGPGDGEIDRVESRQVIRGDDRLAQRSWTAVIGVRDRERRKQHSIFQPLRDETTCPAPRIGQVGRGR